MSIQGTAQHKDQHSYKPTVNEANLRACVINHLCSMLAIVIFPHSKMEPTSLSAAIESWNCASDIITRGKRSAH